MRTLRWVHQALALYETLMTIAAKSRSSAVLQNETFVSLHSPFLKGMIEPSCNEDVQGMHRLEFRNPRFSVDLPAQLCIANQILAGRCTDIGIKGMRLDLPSNVVSGCQGTVCLHYQNQTIELKVRVARIGPMHCGLEFVCDSHAERSTVVHLLAMLETPPSRHQISLVPRIDASLSGRPRSIS
jgi:hypothetical protein